MIQFQPTILILFLPDFIEDQAFSINNMRLLNKKKIQYLLLPSHLFS